MYSTDRFYSGIKLHGTLSFKKITCTVLPLLFIPRPRGFHTALLVEAACRNLLLLLQLSILAYASHTFLIAKYYK